MNQGLDVTFARKPGASLEDAQRLAASIKARLPFPMGITFGTTSVTVSNAHPDGFQFESHTLLPLQDTERHLAEVIEAIHTLMRNDGWELYDAEALPKPSDNQPAAMKMVPQPKKPSYAWGVISLLLAFGVLVAKQVIIQAMRAESGRYSARMADMNRVAKVVGICYVTAGVLAVIGFTILIYAAVKRPR
ncbi:MAG: hypothetical protein WCJ97_12025 [Phycisphaerae bacterium]